MTETALKHVADYLQSALDELNANLKIGLAPRYSMTVSVRDQLVVALDRLAVVKAVSEPEPEPEPDTTGWLMVSKELVEDGDLPFVPDGSVYKPMFGRWAIPPAERARVENVMRLVNEDCERRNNAQMRPPKAQPTVPNSHLQQQVIDDALRQQCGLMQAQSAAFQQYDQNLNQQSLAQGSQQWVMPAGYAVSFNRGGGGSGGGNGGVGGSGGPRG